MATPEALAARITELEAENADLRERLTAITAIGNHEGA